MGKEIRERFHNKSKTMLDLKKVRAKEIEDQSSALNYFNPTKDLANKLHPVYVFTKIASIVEETPDIRTYRLVPDFSKGTKDVPTFRAGQAISIFAEIDGSTITRPYTLSSSPIDALHQHYWEVTIKKDNNGFFTPWLWENWKVGTEVKSSSPFGFLYHDYIRDTNEIVAIVGGSGVSVARTLARDIIQNDLPYNCTVLYGARTQADLAFKDEFDKYDKESGGKVKVTYVLSDEGSKDWSGETGFINADIISKAGDPAKKTYFLCGPKAMYDFLAGEFEKLGVPKFRVRQEAVGSVDITKYEEFPKDQIGKVYKLTVTCGNAHVDIEAKADESMMTALERNGIAIPARCRGGECGFCNSLLVKGDVFYRPDAEYRRIGDLRFNHIHPCVTYPLSDAEIEIQLVQE